MSCDNRYCSRLLATINPEDVAMFRFLLEAHDNLAGFTTLDRKKAMLKIFFPPENLLAVEAALIRIKTELPICWEAWPFPS